jgi:hypothetical protein
MLNGASLPRTGPSIDVAEVVAALRHGLLTLTGTRQNERAATCTPRQAKPSMCSAVAAS